MAERPNNPADAQTPADQLHRSSVLFLAEVERLQELEREKQAMEPSDDRRPEAALEIEDITGGLLSLSRYQTRLVHLERQASAGRDVAPPRAPATILEEWRKAERRLHEARVALAEASDDADRLRTEHLDSVSQGEA